MAPWVPLGSNETATSRYLVKRGVMPMRADLLILGSLESSRIVLTDAPAPLVAQAMPARPEIVPQQKAVEISFGRPRSEPNV